MAESFIQASFDSAVAYSLATLASPHLTLKEEQLQAVMAVYEGKDVFVRLPTGFGKSLCYQVLPFVFDHKLGLIGSGSSSAVLVISPLLSLMVDQVQSLRSGKCIIATYHARWRLLVKTSSQARSRLYFSTPFSNIYCWNQSTCASWYSVHGAHSTLSFH